MNSYFLALKQFFKSDQKTKKKIKAIFWFLIHRTWIKRVQQAFSENQMNYLLEVFPWIYYMPRQYIFLSTQTTKEQRLNLILNHCLELQKQFGAEVTSQIFQDGIEIADFSTQLKSIKVRLEYDHLMRHEGLLSLKLVIDGRDMYQFQLVINQNCLKISGVQGSANGLEVNRWFTKTFFGLRPQNFLFQVVSSLAKSFGIPDVEGVSSRCQIYQLRSKSQNKIKFSLDQFWQELNAIQTNTCWFKLPNAYPKRAIDTIKSKKRSLYKKRYHFLNQVELEISHKLSRLKPP